MKVKISIYNGSDFLKTEMSERNPAIDILKGIAIISVIIGHCIQCGSGSDYLGTQSYLSNRLYLFIYGAHMPLFMIISGYLFFPQTQRKNTSELLKNIVTRQLIPILCWSIAAYSVRFFTHRLIYTDILTFLYDYIYFAFDYLWFLSAIAFSSAVTLVIRSKLKNSVFIHIIICVAMFFIPDTIIHATIKYTHLYFICGYFYSVTVKKSKSSSEKISKLVLQALVSLTAYIFLLTLWNADTYIYVGGFSVISDNYIRSFSNNILRWITGFAGVLFCVFSVKSVLLLCHIKSGTIQNRLAWLGQNTLTIYIVSSLILTPILKKLTVNFSFSYVAVLAETLIIAAISVITCLIVSHTKIIKKIFFGGR